MKNTPPQKVRSLVAALFFVFCCNGIAQEAHAFTTRIVTTLDTTAYYLPKTSTYGNTVAWKATDSVNNVLRIFFWDSLEIRMISPATISADEPSVANGAVAFTAYIDGNLEIFYWDGTYVNCEPNLIRITNNLTSDSAPTLSGGQIAWQGFDGNDLEIFLWNGTFTDGSPNIVQITDNNETDAFPEMDNGLIAWRHDDPIPGFTLQYWDGVSVRQLSDNFTGNDSIGVHNGGIAWAGTGACANGTVIYYWDGTYTAGVPNITQVTNNACTNIYDLNPSLYNGTITWLRQDQDEAIFYWNGVDIVQISEWSQFSASFDKPAIHSGGISYGGRQAPGYPEGLQNIRFVTGLN